MTGVRYVHACTRACFAELQVRWMRVWRSHSSLPVFQLWLADEAVCCYGRGNPTGLASAMSRERIGYEHSNSEFIRDRVFNGHNIPKKPRLPISRPMIGYIVTIVGYHEFRS